ncbi:hypothetical protein JTE90_001546 [Oedothorax gibbosus]|uniref:DDE Tnp4 domain-containing protein n=1 Tax=Oedothorax gibbosus TaxID=931172 RepID=A0AAV6VNF2_9ARAC|nr:hypothetical protein JTE90_001546 [Oedothorax gibbosus]
MDEKEFKDKFRINRSTFDMMCQMIDGFQVQHRRVVREPLSTGKRLAITLLKLGSSGELRSFANLFKVARSTVSIVVNTTCKKIVHHFGEDISFPQDDELLQVAKSFLGLGDLPGVCGALDGTRIPIKAPITNARDYYNRKSFYSFVLQAVVDYAKSFRNINFGWPGSVHDARVLYNSDLFQMFESGELLNQKIELPGTNRWVDLYLVGDPAYPLKTWLMKPVSGTLSLEEDTFNKQLSRRRVHVEHAFGMLKGRFHCLLKEIDVALKNMQHLVAACCILRNFCQMVQDEYLYTWEEPTDPMNCVDTTVFQGVQTTDAKDMQKLLIDWGNLLF